MIYLKYFLLIFISCNSFAHIIHGESGFLHPLTGIDHMIAMIAVGAWSAQLGGGAIIKVPASFVIAMLIGGMLGFYSVALPYIELGIILSVLFLGLAIFFNHKSSLFLAIMSVLCFGVCHGYSHGTEMPSLANKYIYIFGFLATTASLHLIGAVGGLLILDKKYGYLILKLFGLFSFLIGLWLLYNKLSI